MNGSVSEMPERERPLSEQFRLVAKAWVDADAAARLLEETKSSVFSKLVLSFQELNGRSLPDGAKAMEIKRATSNAQAENMARASDEYMEHIQQMVAARDEANLRKVQMEYIRMRFSEWQSLNANARDERRMSR